MFGIVGDTPRVRLKNVQQACVSNLVSTVKYNEIEQQNCMQRKSEGEI